VTTQMTGATSGGLKSQIHSGGAGPGSAGARSPAGKGCERVVPRLCPGGRNGQRIIELTRS